MKKKNIIYILLIVLTLCGYYYFDENNDPNVIDPINITTSPIYQSGKSNTYIYDISGSINEIITADNVKYFSNNQTEFDSPYVILYNKEGNISWQIQSNHANLIKNQQLNLIGNVVLTNQEPNFAVQKILTDNANVDLTTQDVKSQDLVSIEGPNFNSTGVGLSGNLRSKVANILDNVKTYYASSNTQLNK